MAREPQPVPPHAAASSGAEPAARTDSRAKASEDETATAGQGPAPADGLASRAIGGAGSAELLCASAPPREHAEARVYFREGETRGALEIVSIDAAGQATVHMVAGLALHSLNVKAAEALRRAAS